MAYTPTYEDAPQPTPDQVKASRRAAKKRGVFLFFEIVVSLLALFVLPIVLGLLTWHFLPQTGNLRMSEPVAIFFGVLVCVFSFFWGLLVASGMKGKPLTHEDLQMFHCSERPISTEQWYEVGSILGAYPNSIGKVADWVATYEGRLLHRHLWELRRLHVVSNFALGVVETSEAKDAKGDDVDMLAYVSDKKMVLPKGPGDILNGRLLMCVQAEAMRSQAPSAKGEGPRPRL